MHAAAILETNGQLFPLLLPIASRCACRLLQPAPGEKLRCAMLIVSPDWQGEAPEIYCRILLTPPEKAAQLSRVRAEWIVSFGPSSRASISFSSRTPESLTLSVHREVPTLSGKVLVTVRRRDRDEMLPIVKGLAEMGFELISTEGTGNFLDEHGIKHGNVCKLNVYDNTIKCFT